MERITATDIDVILATDLRRYARDTRALRALLTDIAHSLRAASSDVERLHKDVDRMRSARRNSSTPLAAAVDALTELSVEQRQEVFTLYAHSIVTQLNEQLRQVRARQIAVVSAARAAADKISEHDPELADTIRQLAQAGQVHSSQLEVDFEPFTVTTFDNLFTLDNDTETESFPQPTLTTETPQPNRQAPEENPDKVEPASAATIDSGTSQELNPQQWDELFDDSSENPNPSGPETTNHR